MNSSKKVSKKDKFEDQILREVNSIFRTKISDSRLKFVSVTRVELSVDFSFAKVYWDTFDPHTRGDAKKAVDGVASKVRSILARTLKVRHVPMLSFIYDSQFESEQEVLRILDSEAKLGRGH